MERLDEQIGVRGTLTGEDRLAVLSTLDGLTERAFALFDPDYPVSAFLEHLAEAFRCAAALYLEFDHRDQRVRLVGSAGLSRASQIVTLPRVPLAADGIDWTAACAPLLELRRRATVQWAFPIIAEHPEAQRAALIVVFDGAPQLGNVVKKSLAQVVARMERALVHRRLHARLVRKHTLLECQSETSDRGILMVSTDGTILSFNRRLREIWRLPDSNDTRDAEVLFERMALQAQDPERVRSLLKRTQQWSGSAINEELTLQNGRTVTCYTAPLRTPGVAAIGRGWYFLDITARQQAEKERMRLLDQERQARAEAERAVRVRDDFLSVASHELKTPLTPLALRLQSLQRAAERGQPLDPTLLERAMDSLRKVSELVNRLLDTSRIESGRLTMRFERCSLNDVVRSVVDTFADTPGHEIALEEGEPHLMVHADRIRLEQVCTNLLDNAIKYSPRGGHIRVTLSSRREVALLEVSDEGIGVSPREKSSLFDRFYRAQNAPPTHFGGLGLGLFISREIVERHGGRIWLNSEEGRGTTFFVALPRLPYAEPELSEPVGARS